jgi:hypothetical protein
MRRIGPAIISICLTAAVLADTAAPTTQPAKTGAFDITFTQRSPDTEYSKLVERIGLPKETLGTDYDLSQEPLTAYVPGAYDPKKPIGLIMQIWQDGSPEIYQGFRPALDDLYFMMIATKKDHRPELNGVGICLDAIFNVRKTYDVDPTRIYFFGLGQTEEPIGWSTGDVVTGDLYCWWVGYNKPIGTNQPLFQVNPPPRLMNLVKSHMQILGFPSEDTSPGASVWWRMVADRMENDGFDYVKVEPVSHAQLNGPDWFKARIQQLELVKVQPPGAPAAAGSQPAPSDEPTRLLHLAQAYLSSGMTDKAKEKLNLLIQKYPTDPAAAKAKELLSQIGG